MLTYDFSSVNGPLYKALYDFIREDILRGRLTANEKMPSKRMLAENLGVSSITIENAYDRLISEGYMYSVPKKGYYVADLGNFPAESAFFPGDLGEGFKYSGEKKAGIIIPEHKGKEKFNFSSNKAAPDTFPFATWAKIMREIMSSKKRELLETSPCGGVWEIREAISSHLASFRGMHVDPDQIIVGAGTEYLYGLLIQLLGREKVYCVENPGYLKTGKIYINNGVKTVFADLDDCGLNVDSLMKTGADIVHISPTHHFPTGITMPAKRRMELLGWANEREERFILEDDYDSEFRLNGKPVPPLMSMDSCGKVVYMNTFSKSLSSTIRISYMVLPEKLANEYYQRLSFYACTVSNLDQYTLAEFIKRGYFEKHINRMRLYYSRKRKQVLEVISGVFDESECRIIENDSGLHFLMELNTDISERSIKEMLSAKGIRIQAVTDFAAGRLPGAGCGKLNITESRQKMPDHRFILNYSKIDTEGLEEALAEIKYIINK